MLYIILGSIDDSTFDDKGLLSQLPRVDNAENGFTVISYTEKEDFAVVSDDDRERLKRHLKELEWDQSFVDHILNSHQPLLTDIEKAVSYQYFQYPKIESTSYLPAYIPMMDANRLLILRSMDQLKKRQEEDAIDSFALSLKLAQTIKSERNAILISYWIGDAMIYESLYWLQSFFSEYRLNSDQYKLVAQALDNIKPFLNDGFKEVFIGEFKFAQISFDEFSSMNLSERLDKYWEYQEYSDVIDASFQYGFEGMIATLLPSFYYHKNKSFSLATSKYLSYTQESSKLCGNIILPKTEDKELHWYHYFQPNIAGEYYTLDMEESFPEYFYRRCLARVYIDAATVSAALQQYHTDFDELPEQLSQLVPQYINEIPKDAFDGQPLRYSKENEWIYSVGMNLIDDGGSEAGYYDGKCFEEAACYDNPTVSIYPLDYSEDEEYSTKNSPPTECTGEPEQL